MSNENKPKRINLDLPPTYYEKLCTIQGKFMQQKKRPVSQVETLLVLINRFDIESKEDVADCGKKINVR